MECYNPFGVAERFCHVTRGRLSRNRANPGLSDAIPSGLKEFLDARRVNGKCQGRMLPHGQYAIPPTERGALGVSVQVADFRRSTLYFTFFTPFLSWKELISRRLQGFTQKFYFGRNFKPGSQAEIEKLEPKQMELNSMRIMTFNIITLDGRATRR
jgi:hypothetical protein